MEHEGTMPIHPQCPHCQKYTVMNNHAPMRRFGNHTPTLFCDSTIGGCGADLTTQYFPAPLTATA